MPKPDEGYTHTHTRKPWTPPSYSIAKTLNQILANKIQQQLLQICHNEVDLI